ncbi:MAG: hypothetical protein KAS32_13870 [Candidatus Peribacteraceae bacterium]|nr:hypothetical protein [Candidatus Peribacteraceae bacterium]
MYPEHVEFDPSKDAWICSDNNTNTAQEVKRLHPDDTVFLFDRDKGTYTRFTIEIKIPNPIIVNGKLVFKEGETIEV